MSVGQLQGQIDPLKYNISVGAIITFTHILSIVLYCGWTDLSKKFSETFRKLTAYQSLHEIKKRNQEFAIWARLIRETVEYFGWKGFGDIVMKQSEKSGRKGFKEIKTINELIGPFFCGMSVELVVPEINIRLSGPTSTSKYKEVALRFAGPNGILMQLNNNGTEISGDLRGFVCGWLSTYPEEQEVLFCGGEYRIRIENIIIKSTKQSFKEWFPVFYFFDCMINGSVLGGHYLDIITQTHHQILDNLIKHNLKINGFSNDYVKYLNDTFKAFTQNKTELIINLQEIHTNLYVLSGLILEELSVTKMYDPRKVISATISHPINGRNNNLIKPIIFALFPNLRNIVIICSQIEYIEYEFDLLQLSSIIHSSSKWISNELKIKVKALYPSWISKQMSPDIVSTYESKQCNIKSETKFDVLGNNIEYLTIWKKK